MWIYISTPPIRLRSVMFNLLGTGTTLPLRRWVSDMLLNGGMKDEVGKGFGRNPSCPSRCTILTCAWRHWRMPRETSGWPVSGRYSNQKPHHWQSAVCATGGIRSIGKSDNSAGNRPHDLPPCHIVPEPTALPLALVCTWLELIGPIRRVCELEVTQNCVFSKSLRVKLKI
jgi:hypothetical protein